MTVALTKAEMTAIRDRAFTELRTASTETAIIDAVNAAHRAFYGDARHIHPYFPVNVVFLEGSANAYRAEACRLADDSPDAFRLWRLVEIHTEAAVSTRLLRSGGDPATKPMEEAPPMPTGVCSRDEVRQIFDDAIGNLPIGIEDTFDADRVARLELLREYFCNTEFRADLHEFCFRQTYKGEPAGK